MEILAKKQETPTPHQSVPQWFRHSSRMLAPQLQVPILPDSEQGLVYGFPTSQVSVQTTALQSVSLCLNIIHTEWKSSNRREFGEVGQGLIFFSKGRGFVPMQNETKCQNLRFFSAKYNYFFLASPTHPLRVVVNLCLIPFQRNKVLK